MFALVALEGGSVADCCDCRRRSAGQEMPAFATHTYEQPPVGISGV